MIITDVFDFKKTYHSYDYTEYNFGGDSSFRFDLKKETLDPLPEGSRHSFLYYLNEKRHILAVQHIADIDFNKLDIMIGEKANKENSKEIYIRHWPSWQPEPSKMKLPNKQILVMPGVFTNSQNEVVKEELIDFIKLAKNLKKNNIQTADILIEHFTSPNSRYLQNFTHHVSRELFPGLQDQVSPFDGMESLENKKLNTPKQYEAVFKALKKEAKKKLQRGKGVTGYAFSIEHEYGGYFRSYPLPVTNEFLIPGLLEGQRPLAERLIQSIAYQNENPHDRTTSLVFIVNKHEKELQANAEDILFAKETREHAKKYAVIVDDIILLGQYNSEKCQYDTLKI